RIEEPDGQPCAGARLRVLALRCGTGCVVLPPDTAGTLRATADGAGVATLPMLGPTRVAALEIETDKSGVQRICARRDGSLLDVVRLRACGRIEGKVTGGELPAGLVAEVTTYAPLGPGRTVPMEERRLEGRARVAVAPDGTFVVAAIAVGHPRV